VSNVGLGHEEHYAFSHKLGASSRGTSFESQKNCHEGAMVRSLGKTVHVTCFSN